MWLYVNIISQKLFLNFQNCKFHKFKTMGGEVFKNYFKKKSKF